MYVCKRRYQICMCWVILGELESFRNYKGLSIISRQSIWIFGGQRRRLFRERPNMQIYTSNNVEYLQISFIRSHDIF